MIKTGCKQGALKKLTEITWANSTETAMYVKYISSQAMLQEYR